MQALTCGFSWMSVFRCFLSAGLQLGVERSPAIASLAATTAFAESPGVAESERDNATAAAPGPFRYEHGT